MVATLHDEVNFNPGLAAQGGLDGGVEGRRGCQAAFSQGLGRSKSTLFDMLQFFPLLIESVSPSLQFRMNVYLESISTKSTFLL